MKKTRNTVIAAVIVIVLVCGLFVTYPVNMDEEEREYVTTQINDMSQIGEVAVKFVHVKYIGKKRTDDGYIIYTHCADNLCYRGDIDGKIHIETGNGIETCIYTDEEYNVLKTESPLTFEEYNEQRREMFPLPVRIRMIAPTGEKYKEDDLKKAEEVLK